MVLHNPYQIPPRWRGALPFHLIPSVPPPYRSPERALMRGERSTAWGHSLPWGSAIAWCDFLWGPVDTVIVIYKRAQSMRDNKGNLWGLLCYSQRGGEGWGREMTWNHLVLHEFEVFSLNDKFLEYCKNLSNKNIFPKFIICVWLWNVSHCLPQYILVESERQKREKGV